MADAYVPKPVAPMMPRTLFNEDHEAFRATARRFFETEIAPHHEKWEEQQHLDRNLWNKAGELGLLCPTMPEEYGGSGVDRLFSMIMMEEQARVGDSASGFSLHSDIVANYILNFGNDAQKQHWLPKMASGEAVTAIAMTEPGTGSDLAAVRTRAVEHDDHWVLNGSKTYISNGFLAGLVIVAARTNPEASHEIGLFLVEDGWEGFERGRNLKKLGLPSQDTAELFFDDVKVPKENVLGDPRGGFRTMMTNLAEERLIGSVGFMARAEHAFRETMEFIMERRAFGQAIGTFQNSRFKMASARTELDAAWALTDHCVREHLNGELSAEMAAEVKLFTSEVEGRVVDECLQLHGGAGYMEEYAISRMYADARISRIYAGTSEIMREIIGRGLGLDDRKRN